MGVKLNQWAAAKELGTTQNGTDWSDASGYPVPRVLNENQHMTQYVAVALPWSPSTRQLRTFEADLVTDINKGPASRLPEMLMKWQAGRIWLAIQSIRQSCTGSISAVMPTAAR